MRSRSERHKEHKRKRRKQWTTALFVVMMLVVASIAYMIWQQTDRTLGERPFSGSDDSGVIGEHTSSPEQETDPLHEPPLNDPDSDEGVTTIRLSLVGDIMLGSKVGDQLKKSGYDIPYIYIKEHLQKADAAVGNLEAPITNRGVAQEKEYVFRIDPEALPSLTEAGFDVLTLANNHILDYGTEGLLDTMSHLDEAGVKRTGAGHNDEEAYSPTYMNIKGINVAFFGFSRVVPHVSWAAGNRHPGVASTYDTTRPVQAIEHARQEADLIVVLVHWGVERNDLPEKYQVDAAKRYIDAGADLVVGSHVHTMQGFEHYNGKWIAYNLGNFIFTLGKDPKTRESAILDAVCNKAGECSLSILPIDNGAQPKPMSEDKRQKFIDRVSGISFGAVVDSDGKVTAVEQ